MAQHATLTDLVSDYGNVFKISQRGSTTITLFSFNKKCFQKEINFLILDWLISFDELSLMLNLKTVNSRIMLYLNKAIKVPRAFLRLVCTQLTNQNRSKCSRFS